MSGVFSTSHYRKIVRISLIVIACLIAAQIYGFIMWLKYPNMVDSLDGVPWYAVIGAIILGFDLVFMMTVVPFFILTATLLFRPSKAVAENTVQPIPNTQDPINEDG
ncbi:MAG: hypothetical protein JWO54_893 [Candidatus Saccharibacteria bacterium]|nr:hypothetical protein [Candidatus Saccharibacteria bacterium]MDB5181130.1 hypothetical protein [Candidatus Saccharibacteria bacterium]